MVTAAGSIGPLMGSFSSPKVLKMTRCQVKTEVIRADFVIWIKAGIFELVCRP